MDFFSKGRAMADSSRIRASTRSSRAWSRVKFPRARINRALLREQDRPGIQTYERSAVFLMLKAFYDVAGRENVDRLSVEYSLSSALFILARGNFTLGVKHG